MEKKRNVIANVVSDGGGVDKTTEHGCDCPHVAMDGHNCGYKREYPHR